jgi:phage terminase small subunit
MTKAITDESKPLTAKMMRFVEADLANDGNGTKAAITTKYGAKSAYVTASLTALWTTDLIGELLSQ